MKYSTFPATDRVVSRLGFGAMGFAGWFGESEESDWIAALHAALDARLRLGRKSFRGRDFFSAPSGPVRGNHFNHFCFFK